MQMPAGRRRSGVEAMESMESMGGVSLEIVVRSTEIDVNGHVNNAKYLEYLEWGREEWYERSGLSYETFLALGVQRECQHQHQLPQGVQAGRQADDRDGSGTGRSHELRAEAGDLQPGRGTMRGRAGDERGDGRADARSRAIPVELRARFPIRP